MTRKEQTSVEALNRKFDIFMQEDAKWKKEFESKLTPLVEERADRIVLQNAGTYIWKGMVTIIGFIAAVGAVVHYGPDMAKAFFGK